MARIVLASASESGRAQLGRLLASSGFTVFRACASGGELRRALNACGDGVVLLAGSVPGCLPDELAADFGESFQLLLIGRPEVLAGCEAERVFKLAYPCAGSAVVAAVEMLAQLHSMHLPHRGGGEKALVEQAKALLMKKRGLSEPEAHRRLQQTAMARGLRLADLARQVVQGGTDHA